MMKNVTLNTEQRLFVISNEHGCSCLGFDILEQRAVYLSRELAKLGHTMYAPKYFGSLERYAQYEELLVIAKSEHERTGWRSQSELTPELIGLEGKRVEVRHRWPSGNEEQSRFNVGKSTGFTPCHLELKRRDSIGGCAVCLGTIINVRVLTTR